MRIKKGVDAHVVMSDASELRVSLQTNVVARSWSAVCLDKIGTCMFFFVTARGVKDRPNNAEDLLPWMIWRMDPAQLKKDG